MKANIQPHDRGTFLVESRSRPGEHHIVDAQERTCSCEHAFFRRGLCWHLRAVLADEAMNPKRFHRHLVRLGLLVEARRILRALLERRRFIGLDVNAVDWTIETEARECGLPIWKTDGIRVNLILQ